MFVCSKEYIFLSERHQENEATLVFVLSATNIAVYSLVAVLFCFDVLFMIPHTKRKKGKTTKKTGLHVPVIVCIGLFLFSLSFRTASKTIEIATVFCFSLLSYFYHNFFLKDKCDAGWGILLYGQ